MRRRRTGAGEQDEEKVNWMRRRRTGGGEVEQEEEK